MQEVRVERRFSAPPQAVWDIYTHHEGWNEWAGMSISRLITEGSPHRDGVGAVRELGAKSGLAVEQVVDFEPPKRMTYTMLRGPIPIRNHFGEVRFEPEGDGTRIVWLCRFDSKIPGLGWLIRLGITRFFRKSLEGLAEHKIPDRS